jgi:hypothetical protein
MCVCVCSEWNNNHQDDFFKSYLIQIVISIKKITKYFGQCETKTVLDFLL